MNLSISFSLIHHFDVGWNVTVDIKIDFKNYFISINLLSITF